MDNEVLVKVEGVSKKFCRDLKRSLWYGVKDISSDLFGSTKNGQLHFLPVTLSLWRRVWSRVTRVFNTTDSSFHYVAFRVTFPFNFYIIKWQL